MAWWREYILHILLIIALGFGLVALIPVVLMAVSEGNWLILYVDLAAAGITFSILMARRLPYFVRAGGVMLLTYGLGLTIFLMTDFQSGGGLTWLFAFAVLSGLLLGLKGALLALSINIVTLLLLGWGIATGKIPNTHPWLGTPERMITTGSNFMFLNILVTMMATFVVRGLESTLSRERNSAVRLEEEGRLLKSEIRVRQEMETALSESEARYRQLVKFAPAGIFELDLKEMKFLSVNDIMCEYSGYGREELLALDPLSLLPKEADDPLGGSLGKLLVGEADTEHVEVRITKKDGGSLWVLLSGNPEEDNGVPVRTRMVAYDITQRKQVTLALEESEERYRQLFEHTTDFIFTHDLEGRFLSVNPAICRAFGLSSEEFIGRSIKDFMLSDYRRAFEAGYLKPIIAQGSLNGTSVYTNLEGKEIIVEYRNFLVSKNDRPAYISGTGRDVTAQSRATRALKETEERYRTVFNESPDAITISELATSRYIDVNDGFCRLTGYTREEVVGKSLHDLNMFVKPHDREGYIKELRETGQVSGHQISFRMKDGTIIETELSARKLRYRGQDCLAVVVRDMTALKEAEREKALLEGQLQHAQKMEAVGTLAGGIAHDFNNILAMVMGYGELAQKKAAKGADNTEDVGQIVKAAERASSLVQQILTFSRRSETKLKSLDLNELITHSVKILKYTLPKMIEIETRLVPDLGLIRADATQLEQVLMNLANNAGDSMPEGGRLVFETALVSPEGSTRMVPEMEEGEYILLTVSDTGQGMDEETKGKIFDPFFTTKQIGKGTGLGLSTVYGIIREHDGRIVCHSRPGQGTSFEILLPVQGVGEVSEDRPISPQVAPSGHETILLVDDEEAIRMLGAELLEGVGYRVIQATSGEEALQIFGESGAGVDLVILDLGMPGMGGTRCLKELLKKEPSLKILVASGYSADGRVADTLKDGAAGYLAKPFRLNDLLTSIRAVIED